MNNIWKKCPRSIKLVSVKSPWTGSIEGQESLSGVGVFYKGSDHATFFIKSMGNTEKVLARYMPMGIGPAHPAYISVVYLYDTYRIWCSYVNEPYSIHLWSQAEKPQWMSLNPMKKDEKS